MDTYELARQGVHSPPIEYRVRRLDGEVRAIVREAELSLDESGRPMSLMSVKRDVTEQRTAERKQEELRSQLFQADKLTTLGTLAAGIAHDLNNALVPVLGLQAGCCAHATR
jgi:C4-dicarboxylate-specific signal transduction histidine kinase